MYRDPGVITGAHLEIAALLVAPEDSCASLLTPSSSAVVAKQAHCALWRSPLASNLHYIKLCYILHMLVCSLAYHRTPARPPIYAQGRPISYMQAQEESKPTARARSPEQEVEIAHACMYVQPTVDEAKRKRQREERNSGRRVGGAAAAKELCVRLENDKFARRRTKYAHSITTASARRYPLRKPLETTSR